MQRSCITDAAAKSEASYWGSILKKICSVFISLVSFSSLSALADAKPSDDPNLAKSPIIYATLQAALVFSEDFERLNGKRLANEFGGAHAKKGAGEDVEVGIYNLVSANQTSKDFYVCRFDYDGNRKINDSRCQFENRKATLNYTPSTKDYSIDDFTVSTGAAIKAFETLGGHPEQIQNVKLWKAGTDIQISFKWNDKDRGAKAAFFACHYHGALIACHGQSRPGPNEPKD